MAAAEMPRGVFVTGTDTGVGKTLVAAALGRFLADGGIDVGAMKPVETGVSDPTRVGPDGSLLQWACRQDDPVELAAPYRFQLPLAPSLASQRAEEPLHPDDLVRAVSEFSRRHAFTIVEGAGGLMVPLAGGYLIADLIKTTGFPLLVVVRPGLGTINHTLLTLFAARAMEIPVAGFVINGMPANPDDAEALAPHTLASLASADLLGVLPRVNGGEQKMVESLAEEISRLPTLPWLKAALGLVD